MTLQVPALRTYFAENDFRRQVFWSSAQRPGPAFYSFGKTKVCHLENQEAREENVSVGQVWSNISWLWLFFWNETFVADLNVAVVVDEKVLRFQISVYEV